jgi:hypothetical protein
MMPGVCVVLLPVAPFMAAICADELRAAGRACLLAECHCERMVCHLRDPVLLPLAVRVAWRAMRHRGGGPGSGVQSQSQLMLRLDLDGE